MPCDKIEWAVVLLDGVQLPIRLVDNLPVDVQVFVDSCYWVQKVARIRQTVPTERAKVRKLPHRSPHFCDIASCFFDIWPKVQTEPYASLNDTDLSRLKEDLSHLCYDVQIAQLWTNQEIAVSVAVCTSLHARVDHVHVECETFPDVRISATSKRMKPVSEVDLLVSFGQRERTPFRLLWERRNLWIDRQETVLDV